MSVVRDDIVMAVRWADWDLPREYEHCAFTSRPVVLPAHFA